MKAKYIIDEKNYHFQYEGDVEISEIDDNIKILKGNKLFEKVDEKGQGYLPFTFFNKEINEKIKQPIINFLLVLLKQINPSANITNNNLDEYHHFFNDSLHKEVVNKIIDQGVGITSIIKGFDYLLLESIASDLFQTELSLIPPGFNYKEICIRIIRPNSTDNNPPHRDTWLPDLRGNVNAYIPIVGSNNNSILPIVPYSHVDYKDEDLTITKECLINNIKFTVPGVLLYKGKPIKMIRPKLKKDEIFFFNPHLIHGGAQNNSSVTRISLEIRFWPKNG